MTVRILQGDVRQTLIHLEDQSVQMVCTSPPYWSMRQYLPDGHPDGHLEMGREPTLQLWVRELVLLMRKVRRVLRDDGVAFINVSDSYVGSGRGGNSPAITGRGANESMRKRPSTDSRRRDRVEIPRNDYSVPGLKPKDLMGQPWRLAFALQDDGWWLRQDIIWSKSNPMPESAKDRCTKAHEYVFLLTKKEHYFWNRSFKEPVSGTAKPRVSMKAPDGWDASKGEGGHGAFHKTGRSKTVARPTDRASRNMGREPGWRTNVKNNSSFAEATSGQIVELRNPRSVWNVPIHGFKGAHFATFPPLLAEKCILAGSRPGDTVLDPFGGAGTTGMVADRLHRHSILCELDERSTKIAADRIAEDARKAA